MPDHAPKLAFRDVDECAITCPCALGQTLLFQALTCTRNS